MDAKDVFTHKHENGMTVFAKFPLGVATAELSWYTSPRNAQMLLTEPVMYFNRLFVPARHRRQKVGTLLVKTVLDVADEQNFAILLEPNPYEPKQMSLESLVSFYVELGFTLRQHPVLVYHPGDRNGNSN